MKIATTPSQPISGTGRGKDGWLSSSRRPVTVASIAALMPPMMYSKKKLSARASSNASRMPLSQTWKPVRSAPPISRVAVPRKIAQPSTQTTSTPSS